MKTEITIEQYNEAVLFVDKHKPCAGCNKIFIKKDVNRTVQFGTEKWWCTSCYDKIKKED